MSQEAPRWVTGKTMKITRLDATGKPIGKSITYPGALRLPEYDTGTDWNEVFVPLIAYQQEVTFLTPNPELLAVLYGMTVDEVRDLQEPHIIRGEN